MWRHKLASATIDGRDLAELVSWLRTEPWLTQGELVRSFERRFASWVGTTEATFVNSGSSANLLMFAGLLQAGRLPKRRVVVPAVSWPTTVAPAMQLGIEPIPCDADPVTLGLDLAELERICRTRSPDAVIVVHVLGTPVDVAGLLELRDTYGFALMEDACAATGSRYDDRRVGSFGDLASFSFFFGHHMSTIEGGMVTTSDPDLADLLRQLRAHGWSRDLDGERRAALAREWDVEEFNEPFTFYQPAFNVRSTDLNARLGLAQMERIDETVQRRADNHAVYLERFRADADFGHTENPRAFVSSIAFGVLAANATHRLRVASALKLAGVETRPIGGGNMTRQPFWLRRYPAVRMPIADRVHQTAFQLPNHPDLTAADISEISDVVLGVRP